MDSTWRRCDRHLPDQGANGTTPGSHVMSRRGSAVPAPRYGRRDGVRDATAIAGTVLAVGASRFARRGFTDAALRNRQHVTAGVVIRHISVLRTHARARRTS